MGEGLECEKNKNCDRKGSKIEGVPVVNKAEEIPSQVVQRMVIPFDISNTQYGCHEFADVFDA